VRTRTNRGLAAGSSCWPVDWKCPVWKVPTRVYYGGNALSGVVFVLSVRRVRSRRLSLTWVVLALLSAFHSGMYPRRGTTRKPSPQPLPLLPKIADVAATVSSPPLCACGWFVSEEPDAVLWDLERLMGALLDCTCTGSETNSSCAGVNEGE